MSNPPLHLPAPRATSASPDAAPDRAYEAELLRRYHEDGDYAARNELIERTMPMVHHVARRYSAQGEHREEIVQVGCIGLMKAVDRFDAGRGVAFGTFAIPNIAGEIRRHFRDHGSSIRAPRDVQEIDQLLKSVHEQLSANLQRTPSLNELADAAGVPRDHVLEALAARRDSSPVSLDAPLDEDRVRLDTLGSSDDGYARVDDRLLVERALRVLQSRERAIVTLRFSDGLTQSEIAERVGISQMHVSRLLRQAIDRMRAELEREETADGKGRAQLSRRAAGRAASGR